MTLRYGIWAWLSIGSAVATGAAAQDKPLRPDFLVTSPTNREFAFIDRRSLASERDCGGQNLSPPLAWSGEPATTRSFAILFQDPDGAFGQGEGKWIGYNIPPQIHGLAEGTMTRNDIGMTIGRNDHGDTAYYGPCPPYGTFHHYVFGVYALDLPPGALPSDLNRDSFLKSVKGHTVGYQSLVLVYQRAMPANGVVPAWKPRK